MCAADHGEHHGAPEPPRHGKPRPKRLRPGEVPGSYAAAAAFWNAVLCDCGALSSEAARGAHVAECIVSRWGSAEHRTAPNLAHMHDWARTRPTLLRVLALRLLQLVDDAPQGLSAHQCETVRKRLAALREEMAGIEEELER